jgi:hypothetical protein
LLIEESKSRQELFLKQLNYLKRHAEPKKTSDAKVVSDQKRKDDY